MFSSGCFAGVSVGKAISSAFPNIHDLDLGILGKISKFADAKLGSIVNCEEDSVKIEKDRDMLLERADKSQMKVKKGVQGQRGLTVYAHKLFKVARAAWWHSG